MAAHTQIIDLYGIPACGKTTLAEYMASHPINGLRVVTMHDCMHSALKNKWKLVKSVSLKNIGASIRLKFSAPLDKKRRYVSLLSIVMMGVYRKYVRKYTDFDVVVSDHGDVQQFVSLERGDDLHETKKFIKACAHYLDASLTTAYVDCKIDAETALQRMNDRGREKGRIDLIGDQNVKLQELEKEIKHFDFWASFLKQRGKSVMELDMNDSTSAISDILLSNITI